MWTYTGQRRPPFAQTPGSGQESVWDYPRPPALDPEARLVEVFDGATRLASTRGALRLLETASPPTVYLPPDDVALDHLVPARGASHCEWKGAAQYWALKSRPEAGPVGWSYPNPTSRFRDLAGYLSFYPGRVACFVEGERVRPQPGGFYGGWLTDEIVGPVKGEPGTGGW